MKEIADIFRFILYALAVFRVTHMLWHENGPFDVFDWLRAKVGIRIVNQYPNGESVAVAEGFWAELLNCPWCMSVWFAVPATVALFLNNLALDLIATWLALSAVSVLLFGWRRQDVSLE